MKRRGFFGAIFGAVATPIAAKAVDAFDGIERQIETLPVTPAPKPQPLPRAWPEGQLFSGCAYASGELVATAVSYVSARTRCAHCGRRGTGFQCEGCGAPL